MKNILRVLIFSLCLLYPFFSVPLLAKPIEGFNSISLENLGKAKEVSKNFLDAVKNNNYLDAYHLMAPVDYGLPTPAKPGETIQQFKNALDKVLGEFSNYEFKSYKKISSQGYSYLYLTYEIEYTNGLVDAYITIANFNNKISVLAYQFMPQSLQLRKKFDQEFLGQ
ncbi:MAG: hypothetical protein PHU64_07050 [Candidatus Omnitrophica bacterium]|nr:hypothetical protein [Candidatus Omnitrophota bacterium]MDD5430204.1 hypothetical protein [Candidatus Omnitrophota bacterium]